MRLFDELILKLDTILKDKKELDYSKRWEEGSENAMLFKSDTAFELGGCGSAIGSIFYASDSLGGKDSVYLLGPDIMDIKEDTPYARITILDIKDDEVGTGNALYQSLRRMDYVRYHIYPKDAMVRISSMNKRESLLVGKKAKKNSLGGLGAYFINEYHKVKGVRNASVIFITDKNFPYNELEKLTSSSEDITKALDHLLNKVSMDCHSCSLKKVCDEVSVMVKEDFKEEA